MFTSSWHYYRFPLSIRFILTGFANEKQFCSDFIKFSRNLVFIFLFLESNATSRTVAESFFGSRFFSEFYNEELMKINCPSREVRENIRLSIFTMSSAILVMGQQVTFSVATLTIFWYVAVRSKFFRCHAGRIVTRVLALAFDWITI